LNKLSGGGGAKLKLRGGGGAKLRGASIRHMGGPSPMSSSVGTRRGPEGSAAEGRQKPPWSGALIDAVETEIPIAVKGDMVGMSEDCIVESSKLIKINGCIIQYFFQFFKN
jgi:hypothetical protein